MELKKFGPDQLKEEYTPEPPEGVELRTTFAPTQYGLVLAAVMAGDGFTCTMVVPVAVQPALSVTVTVYTPAAARLSDDIAAGFFTEAE